MNQDELKQFWEDIASGIWCSSIIGWEVEKIEGSGDKYVVHLYGDDPNDKIINTVLNVDVQSGLVGIVSTFDGAAANDDPLIRSAMSINVHNSRQEFVDAISDMVDACLWDAYYGDGAEEF